MKEQIDIGDVIKELNAPIVIAFHKVGDMFKKLKFSPYTGMYNFIYGVGGMKTELLYGSLETAMAAYNNYKIVTPWYENIPEQGILCWVSDTTTSPKKGNNHLSIIYGFNSENSRPYYHNFISSWKYATPLTKEEILDFVTEG